jgi:signal transduction histidine kinase
VSKAPAGSKPKDAAVAADHRSTPPLRSSIFARLVVIMVAMAASLLLLVIGFFGFVVSPTLHSSTDRVMADYTRSLATTSPDLPVAMKLRAELRLETRYEGPRGRWATAPEVPDVREAPALQAAPRGIGFLRQAIYVVPAPDGGTYVFAWGLGRHVQRAHDLMLALLVTVMAVVIVATYLVIERMLRPLRRLSDGVARLGSGELDVSLPENTRDEFGRLTEAFNRMVRRVRAMIGARDQLLLDVSHELRSPLTRLKVALELSPDVAGREGMAADVAEMERMVMELLELERLRSGRGLQRRVQDLRPLLEDVAAAFAAQPPGVTLELPSGALSASIDAEKVCTVFRNLLENAVKYSRAESRPIHLGAERRGTSVVVRVQDDGPGIPPEDAERVFEPFFRVDRSRSKNTGGYGLGLSICKRIMEAHDGDIVLDRNGRPGASFVLTFPAA